MKFIRNATRVGGRSIAVVIPAEIVAALKIKERQQLTVRLAGKKIVVERGK
jgi:antitoxin component of MazEF toxin-antitoxin module